MVEVRQQNYPEVVMQRHSLDPLRGVIVDNHGIAPESRIQPMEKLGKLYYKPSLFLLHSRMWKSDEVNWYV